MSEQKFWRDGEYFGDKVEKLSPAAKATPEGFVFRYDRWSRKGWWWKQVLHASEAKLAGHPIERGPFRSRRHALADLDLELRRRADLDAAAASVTAQADHVVPAKL